ncbi:MAG: quinone-dependent dihydroorotate dehydrogenase [Bauldia sp.]|nr:quinone-dependent dihydroorotate dehydrogenase [Bauldia sp.]
MSGSYDLVRPVLFSLDPERAHRLALKALATGFHPRPQRRGPGLAQTLLGLDFPNPIGMAAGFDKNGEVPDALLSLGFGFTEVGTVTPKPQAGNPKPRVFRLPAHHALINRLGFNGEGHAAVHRRLADRRRVGVVGVNVGANKTSPDRTADYAVGVARFADVADYFTVNISSPNTPGLRNLQAGEALKRLLDAVFEALAQQGRRPPVFLKLAPDLDAAAVGEIAGVIAASPLDGVMISNTTLSRSGVEGHRHAGEAGGLSGRPLFQRSTVMLARFRQQLPATLPLIGIGGVGDAATAWAKFEAGAALVQLYSRMVYEGPFVARDICKGLIARMDREKIGAISELTGRASAEWAAKPLEGGSLEN